MNKSRLVIFFTVLLVIPSVTYIVIQLARGYRPDLANRTLKPTGLLVARSTPENARVLVDGKDMGETETTLNLDPGSYLVKITKAEFHPWQKQLTIEKELVTQAHAFLIKQSPPLVEVKNIDVVAVNLSPDRNKLVITGSGTIKPTNSVVISPSLSPENENRLPTLYTIDLSDSPLNLNRDPKAITTSSSKISWDKTILTWSPDSRSILARIPRDTKCTDFDSLKNPCAVSIAYLLDASRTNAQPQIVTNSYKQIVKSWQDEKAIREDVPFSKLPKILQPILQASVKDLIFSPDETKVMYTATSSAIIPEQLIPPIPAINSQPQERDIKPYKTYIYDIKEDTNFSVMQLPIPTPTLTRPLRITPQVETPQTLLSWFPTSRHLLHLNNGRVSLMEYDATNLTQLFGGIVNGENVIPTTSGQRLYFLQDHDNNSDTLPRLMYLDLKT
jgi:hypothetical protein